MNTNEAALRSIQNEVKNIFEKAHRFNELITELMMLNLRMHPPCPLQDGCEVCAERDAIFVKWKEA